MGDLLRAGASGVLVLAMMLLAGLVLWVGVPLGWLYVGSLVQGASDSVGLAILVMLVGVVASIVAVVPMLGWLNRKHLELRAGDLPRASAFYAELCGWRRERIDTGSGSYLALDLGEGLGGGVVECGTRTPVWLPYVEVGNVSQTTERARGLGAAVLLETREGPAGWRSVIEAPGSGELALWQPKR